MLIATRAGNLLKQSQKRQFLEVAKDNKWQAKLFRIRWEDESLSITSCYIYHRGHVWTVWAGKNIQVWAHDVGAEAEIQWLQGWTVQRNNWRTGWLLYTPIEVGEEATRSESTERTWAAAEVGHLKHFEHCQNN